MALRKHAREQIINRLREVEVALAKGATVVTAVRGIAVTEQTHYRWRREYGGLTVEQARRVGLQQLWDALATERSGWCELLPEGVVR